MFSLLVKDPVPPDPTTTDLIENFPYPPGFSGDARIRNNYAARRIAQWAVNAVDFRDTDVKFTRLRYDPDPFNGGFDLNAARLNVVWGMEASELEITETLAFHDKRIKRNLPKEPADPMDADRKTADGELQVDEDPDNTDADPPDSDMDQFRIPEATAIVEIHSLRSPITNNGEGQPSYPPELYTVAGGTPRLDLGRTVGSGNLESPVYRLAVGQPTAGDRRRSTRWNFDAERLGNGLVVAANRPDELSYLTTPALDWTDAAAVSAAVDDWKEAAKYAAEIRHSASMTDEFVTISDEDFDPVDDGTDNFRIRLERFVWFTKNLTPNNGLNVISNAASGMRLGNVYFNKNDLDDPNDANDPDNVSPTLAPGQYAVIGPRQITRFGQTKDSNATNDFDYRPVDQRLEFISQTTGTLPPFRLNMFDFANTRLTPRYAEDNTGYDVESVVPILCQALYPHEVDPARTDWSDYLNNNNPDEIVDMGFNISAPESGASYYEAPEYRITADVNYPIVDGYRDYDAVTGFHPDHPFDHQTGNPLEDNRWNRVGTYQEARTVFLQRLADPTIPWHPVDNPYLTLDFMPIDLTTFNGEQDVRDTIDRDGDGNANEPVDTRPDPNDPLNNPPIPVTRWDGTNFDPLLKFDSRRKIPDVTRDRAITVLLPRIQNPGTSLGDYERVIIAKRSAMSASFSVLRQTGEPGAGRNPEPFWTYSLEALWNLGNEAIPGGGPLNTAYTANPTLDNIGQQFRQTLGFVNREYGKPVRSSSPRTRR